MAETIYLLTGATGYLGSNISRCLLEQGKKVRALVMKGDRSEKYVPEGTEIVYGDVTDKESLEAFFRVPEGMETVVIHGASIVYLQYAPNPKVYEVNVEGTKNIVDQCIKYQVKKLIHISSTGAITELPAGQAICEPHAASDFEPEKLVGYYSQTKAWATQYVLEAVECRGLDASIIYPSGICGPNDYAFGPSAQYVEDFCNGKMTTGVHGTFNSVDVRDLAEGTIACVEKGRKGEGYILSNELLTMEHMTQIISGVSGVKMYTQFIPVEVMKQGTMAQIGDGPDREAQIKELEYTVYNISRNNLFSCEKAKKELGYHTRSVEQTIRDEVEWLIEEGRVQKKDGLY